MAATGTVDTENCVETVWSKLKDTQLDAAIGVCSLSKNHHWRPETLWWNKQVDEAMQEKWANFIACEALKKGGKTAEAQEVEIACFDTKYMTKHTIWVTKSEAEKENSPQYHWMLLVFYVAANRWTTQTRMLLVRTVNATMLVGLHSLMKTRCWVWLAKQWAPWGLLNSPPSVSVTQVRKALIKMKYCWKAAGPSGQDAESCWWGNSWAGKKTGEGCFQQLYEPSRLGGELHPKLLWVQG